MKNSDMEETVKMSYGTPDRDFYQSLYRTYSYDMIEQYEKTKYSHLTTKEKNANIVSIRTEPKIGRNENCPCGSGKKFKKCCLNK